MLQNKKEQFRLQLRRQRNEDLFSKQRQIRFQTQPQNNKENEVQEFYNELSTNNQIDEQRLAKVRKYFEGEFTIQTVYLLQKIVIVLSRDDFENIFEEFQIGNKVVQLLEKEKDILLLDELQYLLGQMSQKSMLCQATLIKLGVINILQDKIQLEIEYDDQYMQSLLYLLTTFVEYNSRIPFDDVKDEIKILEKFCKKLRAINYLEINTDLETEEDGYSETKITLFMRILNFLRFFVDKSSYGINLTTYQNVWIILIFLAFTLQEEYSIRIAALQVIADSIKLNDQYKLDILEKHPTLFFELLTILNHHQNQSQKDVSIKYLASIIFQQLLSINNQQIYAQIHQNQIPLQFVQIVAKEQNQKILSHQLEALFFLCNYSSYEQCKQLYESGIFQILFGNFEQMISSQDFTLAKQMLKLTYTAFKHSQEDQNLSIFLKAKNIEIYLNAIVEQSKHSNTSLRAQKLLEFIQN